MAIDLQLPKVPDPLAGLRASVDAHKQATQASVDAGAAVQAERQAPAAPVEQTR